MTHAYPLIAWLIATQLHMNGHSFNKMLRLALQSVIAGYWVPLLT